MRTLIALILGLLLAGCGSDTGSAVPACTNDRLVIPSLCEVNESEWTRVDFPLQNATGYVFERQVGLSAFGGVCDAVAAGERIDPATASTTGQCQSPTGGSTQVTIIGANPKTYAGVTRLHSYVSSDDAGRVRLLAFRDSTPVVATAQAEFVFDECLDYVADGHSTSTGFTVLARNCDGAWGIYEFGANGSSSVTPITAMSPDSKQARLDRSSPPSLIAWSEETRWTAMWRTLDLKSGRIDVLLDTGAEDVTLLTFGAHQQVLAINGRQFTEFVRNGPAPWTSSTIAFSDDAPFLGNDVEIGPYQFTAPIAMAVDEGGILHALVRENTGSYSALVYARRVSGVWEVSRDEYPLTSWRFEDGVPFLAGALDVHSVDFQVLVLDDRQSTATVITGENCAATCL